MGENPHCSPFGEEGRNRWAGFGPNDCPRLYKPEELQDESTQLTVSLADNRPWGQRARHRRLAAVKPTFAGERP